MVRFGSGALILCLCSFIRSFFVLCRSDEKGDLEALERVGLSVAASVAWSGAEQ